MVTGLENQKQLSQARGATRDLTAALVKFKSGTLDSDESESNAILKPKSR